MTHLDLESAHSIFIAGANSGIGFALTKAFVKLNPDSKLFCSYRKRGNAMDLFDLAQLYPGRVTLVCIEGLDEDSYLKAKELVEKQVDRLDVVVNCIGFLHSKDRKPEKSLRDIGVDQMLMSFKVNTMPVVLLAKTFFSLLKNKDPALFVSLSARVGSIGDNRSGGWYSYRASKSAHNMLLKNIALELQRFNCNTLALSIHPGTTETQLSMPYISNTPYKVHTPEQTAENILKAVGSKNLADQGGFFDWQGLAVDW